jgi:deazaflavin-dependent oxidoreductase (nitroreductase family)
MHNFNSNLIDDLRAHDGHATSGPFVGRQVLILTTTGAKTGEKRESPLAYTLDGERIVIVASKGGAPTHPAWYHNVVAHPNVFVELNGQRFEATATVARGDERRRLYDAHTVVHPGFADYETRTERVIPVIVLQRKAATAAA